MDLKQQPEPMGRNEIRRTYSPSGFQLMAELMGNPVASPHTSSCPGQLVLLGSEACESPRDVERDWGYPDHAPSSS